MNKTTATLEDQYGKVEVSLNSGHEHAQELLELVIVPLLLGKGYSPDLIKQYINTEETELTVNASRRSAPFRPE